MSNYDIIEKFWQADLIDKPDDLTSYFWTYDGNVVSWNGENNLEDLLNGDCDTYSEDALSEPEEIDGYMIITLSDSCGGSGQCIFDIAKKV